jgi:UPF0716 family protein affecting phage T7 exclusion
MRKPILFLLALLALPFVELALLLKLGALTDWKVPLLAVVVMAGLGIALIRSIGWLTFRQFQEELEHRRVRQLAQLLVVDGQETVDPDRLAT